MLFGGAPRCGSPRHGYYLNGLCVRSRSGQWTGDDTARDSSSERPGIRSRVLIDNDSQLPLVDYWLGASPIRQHEHAHNVEVAEARPRKGLDERPKPTWTTSDAPSSGTSSRVSMLVVRPSSRLVQFVQHLFRIDTRRNRV